MSNARRSCSRNPLTSASAPPRNMPIHCPRGHESTLLAAARLMSRWSSAKTWLSEMPMLPFSSKFKRLMRVYPPSLPSKTKSSCAFVLVLPKGTTWTTSSVIAMRGFLSSLIAGVSSLSSPPIVTRTLPVCELLLSLITTSRSTSSLFLAHEISRAASMIAALMPARFQSASTTPWRISRRMFWLPNLSATRRARSNLLASISVVEPAADNASLLSGLSSMSLSLPRMRPTIRFMRSRSMATFSMLSCDASR